MTKQQKVFLVSDRACVILSLQMFFPYHPTPHHAHTQKRRSEPSIVREECQYQLDYELPLTESVIQNLLDSQKDNVQACWSFPDFFYKGVKEDGTEVPLHFLEYAGTRQLAEDLKRFMGLIGSDKLSLYGISYGTNVMGTFATIFPGNVDKFVIDSNMYAIEIMNQNPVFPLF